MSISRMRSASGAWNHWGRGSPSCGVGLTYVGPWGSSMKLEVEAKIVDECFPANEPGVMIDVLASELQTGKTATFQ